MEIKIATAVAMLQMLFVAAQSYPGDYKPLSHPCTRPCVEGGQPMLCHYHWLVEDYLTLSRACYQCGTNQTDCWREDCVSADGVTRSIKTINRQMPGPFIQVCEGDTVEVDVVNQMVNSESLTIHWHGIMQRKSPHMDGVAMVTQCPITTCSYFTYRYLAEDPGTHMYHAHAGLIRGDGIYGAVVVRQSPSRDLQRDLYDFDLPQHVIVMSDWAHSPIEQLFTAFYHGTGQQAPDSVLINGRGVYPPNRMTLLGNDSTPLFTFHVQAGLRYRFRVVNAGFLRCPLEFSVDHHPLLLIASDGHPVEPVLVDSILIYSGERYDIVLDTKKDEVGVHWIRVRGHDECEREKVQQFAILRYHSHMTGHVTDYPEESMDYDTVETKRGVRFNSWYLKHHNEKDNSYDNSKPTTITHSLLTNPSPTETQPDEHAQLSNLTSLEPDDVALTKDPDQQIFLEFAYRLRPNFHFHNPNLYPLGGLGYKSVTSTMVNNISNLLPPSPMLTQLEDIPPELLCNYWTMVDRNCSTEYCECFHRVVVREGEVVELVIYNSNDQDGYTHPMHLHGHSFRIVAVERPKDKITLARFKEMDARGEIARRLHKAPLKDTVPIVNGGYLILRILADNPGAWFMHCHVAFHAEIGMSLTLQVNDAEGQLPKPPPGFPRCGSWKASQSSDSKRNLESTGNEKSDTGSGESGSRGSSDAWMFPLLASVFIVSITIAVVFASVCYVQKRKFDRTKFNREFQARTAWLKRMENSDCDDDSGNSNTMSVDENCKLL